MSNVLDVKDQVLAELRLRKIQLWLSPYYTSDSGSSGAVLQVLESLAANLISSTVAPASSAFSTALNINFQSINVIS